MCIIVIKEKGTKMPSRDTLRTCYANNSDGAGFMYNHKGKVVVTKGFMTWKDFDEALTEVEKGLANTKKVSFVFHFRIATHGGTNPMNCHPFPISHFDYMLQQTYLTTDIGVAHNGIISLTSDSGYYDYKEKKFVKKVAKLSDTQIFIRDYLTDIQELNPEFYLSEAGLNLVGTLIESKMAFLDKNGLISTIGSFNDDTNGVLYSNYTWMETKWTKAYGWGCDDYEYEELKDWADKFSTNTISDMISDEVKLIDKKDTFPTDYKVKIMPITQLAYWTSDEEGTGNLSDDGIYGIDEFSILYQIDKDTKECIQYTTGYVYVFDYDGVDIDFDDSLSEEYTVLEVTPFH